MYPGGNNYNPGYPNQQGYNMPPQQYGGGPGYSAGAPPIGFNVDGGFSTGPGYAPGYRPPQSGMYGGQPVPYMPSPQGYPSSQPQQNPQPYMPSSQGYPSAQPLQNPQPYMSSQPLQMYGQGGPQYQHGQGPSANTYSQMQGQPVPNYNPTVSPSANNYPQRPPPQNPAYSQIEPSTSIQLQSNSQMIIDCIGSGGETYKGTIKPFPNFNAEQDCNVLRKAMKGLGTDEKAIIECLGRRNLSQRLEIKKTFKTMFGKDLIDELKSELSGNFSRAVVESLYESNYYDTYSLHKAMEGAGTREDVLTEILTSRSNRQIEDIKDLYKKWFNKVLEKEVISETSGFYKRILVSCLQANKKELTVDEITRLRQQGPAAVVNTSLARQEAQELYNAGEKKIGTDEACFIKIFASRNKYQLRATFDEYQKLAGRDIITSIEREMSGDLASALKAIAMQAIDPALYFATRLFKSMKGAGTNDTALIRILLTRSEIDLENIKAEFQKQYKKTLESFVRGDASGDYLKFLMRFVEGN